MNQQLINPNQIQISYDLSNPNALRVTTQVMDVVKYGEWYNIAQEILDKNNPSVIKQVFSGQRIIIE